MREGGKERETERERETDRQTDKMTDRQTDRQREPETKKDMEGRKTERRRADKCEQLSQNYLFSQP